MSDSETAGEAQVALDSIPVGEYFEIPIKAIIYPGYTYKVVYSVEGDTDCTPYMLVQNASQTVAINKDLYVNNQLMSGGIVNKYTYKSEHISTKAKISMLLLLVFAVQYVLCEGIEGADWKRMRLREEKERKPEYDSGRSD